MSKTKTRFTWQRVIIVMIIVILMSGTVLVFLYNKVHTEEYKLQAALETMRKNINNGKDLRLIEAEKVLALKISGQATQVLSALKNMDIKKLANYIHPEKGTRFSPYSFVNLETDVVLKKEQLTEYVLNERFHWGVYDGSGAPIDMTVQEYMKKFVYDKDYETVKDVGYNRIIGQGNTINNVFEVYPSAIFVEYYDRGSNKFRGMDWSSLRLVFEKYHKSWFLVGVIHEQWTN